MGDAVNKTIDIIGVRFDKGASRSGCSFGPQAIREAGLCSSLRSAGLCVDIGEDIADERVDKTQENRSPKKESMKNLEAINEINQTLYNKITASLNLGKFTLVLGGDHSIAAASVTAIQDHYEKIGLIWMDAHGDFNNAETSPSGNVHGMPLSAITGNGPAEIVGFKRKNALFVNTENTVIIGARALDKEESERINKSGITVFSVDGIRKNGMLQTAIAAIEIALNGTNGIYLSFDMDCLDPSEAPGVGTPENNGITLDDALTLCKYISESGKLLGAEFVELNPTLDRNNITGNVAVKLIVTLLS